MGAAATVVKSAGTVAKAKGTGMATAMLANSNAGKLATAWKGDGTDSQPGRADRMAYAVGNMHRSNRQQVGIPPIDQPTATPVAAPGQGRQQMQTQDNAPQVQFRSFDQYLNEAFNGF